MAAAAVLSPFGRACWATPERPTRMSSSPCRCALPKRTDCYIEPGPCQWCRACVFTRDYCCSVHRWRPLTASRIWRKLPQSLVSTCCSSVREMTIKITPNLRSLLVAPPSFPSLPSPYTLAPPARMPFCSVAQRCSRLPPPQVRTTSACLWVCMRNTNSLICAISASFLRPKIATIASLSSSEY